MNYRLKLANQMLNVSALQQIRSEKELIRSNMGKVLPRLNDVELKNNIIQNLNKLQETDNYNVNIIYNLIQGANLLNNKNITNFDNTVSQNIEFIKYVLNKYYNEYNRNVTADQLVYLQHINYLTNIYNHVSKLKLVDQKTYLPKFKNPEQIEKYIKTNSAKSLQILNANKNNLTKENFARFESLSYGLNALLYWIQKQIKDNVVDTGEKINSAFNAINAISNNCSIFFKYATKERIITSIDEYYNYLQSINAINKFNEFFQDSIQEYYNHNKFKLVNSNNSSLSLILYIYKTPGSFDHGMPVVFRRY